MYPDRSTGAIDLTPCESGVSGCGSVPDLPGSIVHDFKSVVGETEAQFQHAHDPANRPAPQREAGRCGYLFFAVIRTPDACLAAPTS